MSVVDYITYQLIFGDVILFLTIVWHNDGYGVCHTFPHIHPDKYVIYTS